MKFYRDGSIGAFSNYQKAASLSLGFGALIGAIVFWKVLLRIEDIAFITKVALTGGLSFATAFLMFIVYRRPLIIIKNDKFIFYTGLFSSDYIFIAEINKFKIFSDKDSISVDIYNKANLRITFETRALSNLDEKIKRLIEDNLKLEVDCVNSTTNQTVHATQ